jgi:hypothetical protein
MDMPNAKTSRTVLAVSLAAGLAGLLAASDASALSFEQCGGMGGFCDASNMCTRYEIGPEGGFRPVIVGECDAGGGPIGGGGGEPAVQIPTSLQILDSGVARKLKGSGFQITNLGPSGCPTARVPLPDGSAFGPFGAAARVRYQVLDQNGRPIRKRLQIRERISNARVTIIENGQEKTAILPDSEGNLTADGSTEGDGTFLDEPISTCFTLPVKLSAFMQEIFVPPAPGTTRASLRFNAIKIRGQTMGCGTLRITGDMPGRPGNDISISPPRRNCPSLAPDAATAASRTGSGVDGAARR